jgi:hypothetical protein
MRRHPQFSLRVALIAITLCCFAVAGFTYANVFWASAWFTFLIGWLFCSALASIYFRRAMQAFYFGFSLAGGTYLFCVYAPVLDQRVGFWLLTTKSMGVLQRQLDRPELGEWIDPTISEMPESQALAILFDDSFTRTLPQWTSFQLVGHSAFALLFAWCGGLFAARLYEKNRTGPE